MRFASLLLFVIFAACISAHAADVEGMLPQADMFGSDGKFEKKAPVVVNGDKVEYLNQDKKITASGNVKVTYGDVVLTCDTIVVHTDTKIGSCEGNVKVMQLDSTLTGQKVEYNFEQKTGKIIDGAVRADPFYGKAADVEKPSEKEVDLKNGYFTTCDNAKPHYRIQAKEIQFFINDKVIAKHVFMYVKNVPVLYLPYYIQPLNDTKTKVTVVPGYSSEWGYYMLGAYRYYLSEQCKGYLRLDYRTKKGLAEGIDYSYDAGYLGEGTARYYFAEENNILSSNKSGPVKDRYRFQYKHKLDFDADTSAIAEINKLSDSDVVKDYFFAELEDGWTPENYVSVMTRKPNYSTELLVKKRLDDFYTYTEKLPELNVQVFNQRLWDTPFYYQNNVTATNFRKVYAKSDNLSDEESVRTDTYHRLSYVTKLFNFLYTTPYAGTRQTYYSSNRWGDSNEVRSIYEYGVDFSTKYFKTYNLDLKDYDVNKIRHVITPTVGFHHRNQPTISPDNLFQFDTIDAIDYENAIVLSLENKLQTKSVKGTAVTERDILRFIVSTQYLYRFEKGNLGFKDDGRFGDVVYQIEIKPTDKIFFKTDITTYIKEWELNDMVKYATTDFIWSVNDKCNFAMGHIYEHSESNSASQFTSEVDYRINKDWAVRAYERFDTRTNKWEEQEYTIFKDMHCWLGEFSVNLSDENAFAFWVVFRLKAFPETPIGFKRTYRRPSPGVSMGS